MESHLAKVLTRLQTRRGRSRAWAWGASSELRFSLRAVSAALSSPAADRVRSAASQWHDGLPALQDRLDQLRAQEGEADEYGECSAGKCRHAGQLLERSGAAGGQLLKPRAPPRNRLAEGRITSRAAVLLRQSGQYQPGFDTAVLFKATAAVSWTALSLAASDADDATSPPDARPRRSLMVRILSTSTNDLAIRRRVAGTRSAYCSRRSSMLIRSSPSSCGAA